MYSKYIDWLCSTFVQNDNYKTLLAYLMQFPFSSDIRNDFNRAFDGIDLRGDFIQAYPNENILWEQLGQTCTFGEFLCGLANRIDFMFYTPKYGHRPGAYFKILINNLGLSWATNDVLGDTPDNGLFYDTIFRVVDTVNTRSYSKTGAGGLFPLRNASMDQRNTEIWFQLASFIFENKDALITAEV